MPLSPGDKIGHFEVLSLLGRGGMGEVYKARDTKLKRDVALKVLPEPFARDPERMARFQREAEVLASLNHHNIAQIYGVEERALAMELVEGEAPKGPMPFDEAWKIASQIAAALEYAHDKGIIHRDLKPANIKVTPDSTIKLLDFGLAKAFTDRGEARTSDNAENSPTLTIGATEVGVILGTAAYMPPEQAKGKAVDKRADIWSFGVVLYELLTGERLFNGEDTSDTLAQVLTKQPDSEKIPVRARRLLNECLEKDPKQRLRDIGDARRLLEDPVPHAGPGPPRRSWWIAAGITLVLSALGGWALSHFGQPPTDERVLRLQIEPPEGADFSYGANNAGISLSPDGRTAAYVASSNGKSRLWVRPLNETTSRLVPGTEGAGFPFWSPDSKSIAFAVGNNLERVDLAGGAPVMICATPSVRGGSWTSDGHIMFGTLRSGLYQVPASGGTPSPLKILDDSRANAVPLWPQMLPDGRFLYFVRGDKAENTGVYAASIAKPSQSVELLSTETNALYATDGKGKGYLLWLRGSALMAQELDVARLKLTGDPHPVADPVARTSILGLMNAAVSGNGLLLYSATNALNQFTWVDRTGKRLAAVGEALDIGPFRLSPDGRRLATTRSSGLGTDLWLMEVERGVASRFTLEGRRVNPVWSPDGRTILYTRSVSPGLVRKASSGVGGEQSLTQSASPSKSQVPTDWSRDGRFVLFFETTPTRNELWVLPLTPGGGPAVNEKPRRYVGGPFNTRRGRFSPDTRWVAYESDESGRSEIYIDAFPEMHGKVQVSTNGGTFPQWGPGGRELFYVSPENRLTAVGLKVEAALVGPTAPRELFPLPIVDVGVNPYDVAPDGQRFLVPSTPQQGAQPLTLIVNWPALLKKAVTP